MGSGDRFQFFVMRDTFGIGIFISQFPFKLTIELNFAIWGIQLGFGKAYDDDYKGST
jgi:hypothetical protein